MAALDTGAATLHNNHMIDLGNRVGTFCNYLLLVDGGVLSITIGAFLSAAPPRLGPDGLWAIRVGWYSLTLGTIAALSLAFLVLLGQMAVQRKMNEAFTPAPEKLTLHRGPTWLGTAIRALLIVAFAATSRHVGCLGSCDRMRQYRIR